MTTATEAIRAEPHSEIGRILTEGARHIVDEWCARARAEQPTAARHHHEVLRNQLHGFLVAVGEGLCQGGERNPRGHRDQAIEHGEQRWDNGWSLTELVRDYQILQTVILEHLSRSLHRSMTLREVMAIAVFINDAVAASIAAYVANRDHQIRDTERAGVSALRDVQRKKDDFLAMVVHELRNSVGPIVTAAHSLSLMLPEADNGVRDSTRVLNRQSRHLVRILDDLTDLTRIAQGRILLDRRVVDLADIVEHAAKACDAIVQSRSHVLTVQVRARPLPVEGDATRLQQIVVNLLTNAAKYTPPGGDIVLTATRADDVIDIRVRDTGIGIQADKLSQVFDLYARVHEEKDKLDNGLGIGLALVRELVVLHGGTVECRSEGADCGAEFIVRLPAYVGNEPILRATPTGPISALGTLGVMPENPA